MDEYSKVTKEMADESIVRIADAGTREHLTRHLRTEWTDTEALQMELSHFKRTLSDREAELRNILENVKLCGEGTLPKRAAHYLETHGEAIEGTRSVLLAELEKLHTIDSFLYEAKLAGDEKQAEEIRQRFEGRIADLTQLLILAQMATDKFADAF